MYVRSKSKSSYSLATIFTLVFCVGLTITVLTGKLALAVAGLYSVMSLVTFIVYAIDKSAAVRGVWRISEKNLHILALIGGWPGAFFAQKILRHKSSKIEFKRVYWATVILNLMGLFYLQTEAAASLVRMILTTI